MWNQYRNAQLISTYDQAVTDLSDDNYEKLWKEAEEYNAEHPVNSIVDAFNEEEDYEPTHPYDEVLDPNGDGLMGSIEIPKIQAKLAIYHGLSKNVLEKGVGHVEIKTVLPEETSELDIVEGKDLVTLVTCTPYGVNTHRLLVRGTRTEYVEEEKSNDTIPQKLAQTDPKKVLAAGSAVLVILILLVYLIVRRSGKRRGSGGKEEAEKSGKEN